MYVCNVAEISGSAGTSDFLTPVIRAKHLIRRMHGGSQSVLVRGEDEELYVVKFNNNQQGPNLLANEMMGSELLHSVGLPTPRWKAILITDEFINSNQDLCFKCLSGTKPIDSGIHFGTQFVSSVKGREVYDFLPSSFCQRIANPADFLGIYIFDIWANHHDHRQAVYACRPQDRAIDTHFIDNGHLFGGPHWSNAEKYGAAMCLDKNVYTASWDEEDSIDKWISHFETSIPQNLYRTVKQVPKGWYKGDIAGLTELLEFRLRNLRQLFRLELQHNRRIQIGLKTGFGNVPMQLCNSRPLQVRSFLGLPAVSPPSRY